MMSGGWLDRFKTRHGLVLNAVSGEAVDTTAWETKLQKDFQPRDIHNADKTGLFYKCLPNKSLAFQGETCTVQKVPTDRISLLCVANLEGESCHSWQLESIKSQGALKTSIHCLSPIASIKRLG